MIRTRLLVWLVGACCSAHALSARQLPTLEPSDYGRWEALGRGTLSPDGAWLVTPINRTNGDNELRIHHLTTDPSPTVVAFGTNPGFSADSRWLVYQVDVSESERERANRANEPVHLSLGVRNLSTGDETITKDVERYAFSPSGKYLTIVRYAAPGSDRKPDLIVQDLQTGGKSTFGNVASFGWSDVGDVLALAIETAEDDNAVQLYEPALGRLRVLRSGEEPFTRLTWRKDSDDLAVLQSRGEPESKDTTHILLAWRHLASTATPALLMLDPASASETLVSAYRLTWSDDGQRIFFGLRPRQVTVVSENDATGDHASDTSETVASDVQVWHAKDVRIFPMQRLQEQRDRERSVVAVWQLADGSFRSLHTDLMSDVTVAPGGRHVIEQVESPYYDLAKFGRNYADIDVIDAVTGQRRTAARRIRYAFGASPRGKYLLYFDANGFWIDELSKDRRTNLAPELVAEFTNTKYDYPVELYPPFGFAGWLHDESGVLVYDEFDVWMLPTSGAPARRLTNGRGEEIVHRVHAFEEDESTGLQEPFYYSLFGEHTKASGYARGEMNGRVERLIYRDTRVTRLEKADSAAVYVFTEERFDDSPDYFVANDRLASARQVTNTNPFQREFAWGKAALIHYTDPHGRALEGVLLYPPNHDPSRRYPMVVYQYEVLSQQLHVYTVPSERRYYNTTVWNQDGYFVLLPDIVYTGRDPGISAVGAIEAAIESVLALNVVDAERIGLVGHSWGGYQATFLPTQTDRFAAAVAGAPLTNFLSMMGAVHWRQGLPETGHWETGQARMEVPFWEDFDAHVRNSPAAHIANLHTPMLMMFGDDDGTVDFRQGVEFYNYARRAGKNDFVMLVYPGEDHGLRKRENQIDYHRRINEWFGHYLKGAPAPRWITDGIPYLERPPAH